MNKGLSIIEVARAVPCSHWTIRAYLKRGIIRGVQNECGRWELSADALRQARSHLAAHGGPAGRPLITHP